jgi:hypothetical protein
MTDPTDTDRTDTDPADDAVMGNFAAMLGAGGVPTVLGTAMEIPDVLLELGDALDEHTDVVDQAVADDHALEAWSTASPEARSAILLNLAWYARHASLTDQAAESNGGLYAVDLLTYARNFTGDDEAFHGRGFPALPLPGQAGALATSVAFDRDDLPISLETALLMLSMIRTSQNQEK